MNKKIVLLSALIATVLLVLVIVPRRTFSVTISNRTVFANGAAVVKLVIYRRKGVNPAYAKKIEVIAKHKLLSVNAIPLIDMEKKKITYLLQTGFRGGHEKILVRGPGFEYAYTVSLLVSTEDSDNDGIPDVAELRSAQDRYSFRQWFCAIAESQFYGVWDSWARSQQDCAGLVRFSYVEALRKHDAKWLKRVRTLLRFAIADVRAFNYPKVPVLGTSLFRIKPVLREEKFDINLFSPFATARYLQQYNTRFVGYDYRLAKPGDLLFYRQDDLQHTSTEDAMHIMIALGPRGVGEQMANFVVYHTGDPKRGKVRKIALETLMQHPDIRWRPVQANKNYLGVYRFLILE